MQTGPHVVMYSWVNIVALFAVHLVQVNFTSTVFRLCLFCDYRNCGSTQQVNHNFPDFSRFYQWVASGHLNIFRSERSRPWNLTKIKPQMSQTNQQLQNPTWCKCYPHNIPHVENSLLKCWKVKIMRTKVTDWMLSICAIRIYKLTERLYLIFSTFFRLLSLLQCHISRPEVKFLHRKAHNAQIPPQKTHQS